MSMDRRSQARRRFSDRDNTNNMDGETRRSLKASGRMAANRTLPKWPLDHEPTAVTYAREQAGLTKTQLAQACDVALSLISEIESGTRNATPAMIIKIADALNCPRVVLERKRSSGNRQPEPPKEDHFR